MKHLRLLSAILLLMLLCGACSKPAAQTQPSPAPSPGPTPTITAHTEQSDSQGEGQGESEAGEQGDAQTVQGKNRRLYDPSIFVIEASGSWRQELADGYYADYECELYLDKVDANDNRVSDGSYHGFFWIRMELDTVEYLKELLKDVPVEMEFDAGGEGICDNLIFNLSTRDIWERDAYAIPLDRDTKQEAAVDVPVDKGSFIAVAKQAYLYAKATGKQGEGFEHADSQSGDMELSYIIHMEPDSRENGTERRVTIYLSNEQGLSTVLHGTMRRLPGYPDDVAQYTQDAPYQDALNKHLQ